MSDPIRVLHVDDDPEFAELTASFLEREGDRFAVETATDPEAALERLDERVDCVVSDYEMPGMDGIEFLEAVRADHPDRPFILFTGKGSEAVASEAIRKGATDYLRKGPGKDTYDLLGNRIRNAVATTRARERLRRRKDQYQRLFERAPVMFAVYGIEDGVPRLEEANERFYERLGHDPADLRGEPVGEIYTDVAREAAMDEGVDRALAGEFGTAERTLLTADGERIETLNRCVPRVDEDGEVTGLVTLYVDVTGRRERDLFRTLVDHAIDEMYVIDPATGDFVAVNDTACRHLGYERAELLDLSIEDIDAVGIAEGWNESAFRKEERLRRIEGRHRRADGTTYPVEVAASNVELAGGEEYLFAVSRDVSDRAEREQRLGELHDATRRLMDATDTEAAAGIAVEAAERVLGLDVNGFHAPAEAGDALLPVATSEGARELFGDPPPIERGEGVVWEVYETGEGVFAGDIRDREDVYDPDTPVRSEMLLPVDEHGVFIAAATEPDVFDDADEDLARVLASNLEHALDSVRRERELRERERQLEQENERLAEVASIVSHDLRNPLNVIEGHLDLAREDCDCSSDHHLDTMASALDRSFAIIEDVLTLAREGGSVEETETVRLSTMVENCWRNVDTSGATFRIEGDLEFRAAPDRFRHVLENLFRNAVEHGSTSHGSSDGDPVVTIRVGRLEDGFYVADDGPGIPPEDREAVFEAGYSTRAAGTGFGLHIVERIARAHGWEIDVVESAEGGARFEITGVDTL